MPCYIILNSDGRINTVSEKDDNVLDAGQTKETSSMSMVDFIETLPDFPNNCVKVGDEYVSDPIVPTLVYNGDTLISWAFQQDFAPSVMLHMAAFLDFANKATQVSYANFMAYATSVDLVDTATAIVARAIELGANIEVGGV